MWQMSKMYFVYLNRNYSSKKKEEKKRSPWQNLKLVMKCVFQTVLLEHEKSAKNKTKFLS